MCQWSSNPMHLMPIACWVFCSCTVSTSINDVRCCQTAIRQLHTWSEWTHIISTNTWSLFEPDGWFNQLGEIICNNQHHFAENNWSTYIISWVIHDFWKPHANGFPCCLPHSVMMVEWVEHIPGAGGVMCAPAPQSGQARWRGHSGRHGPHARDGYRRAGGQSTRGVRPASSQHDHLAHHSPRTKPISDQAINMYKDAWLDFTEWFQWRLLIQNGVTANPQLSYQFISA